MVDIENHYDYFIMAIEVSIKVEKNVYAILET